MAGKVDHDPASGKRPSPESQLRRDHTLGDDGAPVMMDASLPAMTGSSLGPYELLEMLGQGGMGAVFKAKHTRLGKYVAIKVLPTQFTHSLEALARFDREMKAVGALEHPNIVRATDANEHLGTHYLVMEYVEGQDLQKFVKQHGPLEIGEACRLIRDAAHALQHAHEFNLIHRDIKPSNLLLTKSGQLKVLDLGLARLVGEGLAEEGLTTTGVSLGTPDYMAPEQWSDSHTVDFRTDLYALGCTLYFLIVGRPPFGTEQYRTVVGKLTAHTQAPIPPLRDVRPEVPPALDALYQRLLVKKAAERLASATELIAAIEPFCTGPVNASAKTVAIVVPPGATGLPVPSRNATSKAASPTKPTISNASGPAPAATGLTKLAVGIAAAVIAIVIVVVLLNMNRGDKPSVVGVPPLGGPEQPPVGVSPLGDPKQPADGVTRTSWHGWPADAPPPAIAPFNAEQAKAHQEAWAKYLKVPVEYENSIGMKFRLIPPGEFMMGSMDEEINHALKDGNFPEFIKSEGPRHNVIITQPIFLATHEVTQNQYSTVTKNNPAHYSSVANLDCSDYPVEMVSWNDAAQFCAKLSEREDLKPLYIRTGKAATPLAGAAYRLPTEAEWESACRAGTTTKFWVGERDVDLVQAAWFSANSNGRTHAVGKLRPNPLGLFDVHGNVSEWVQDSWEPTYYAQFEEKSAIDPSGTPSVGSRRVAHGESWSHGINQSRASCRYADVPTLRLSNIGFRVALSVDAVKELLTREKPVTETPSAKPLDLVTADGWLNVLPLVDVKRDGSMKWGSNNWLIDSTGLTCPPSPAGKWGVLLLPVAIDASELDLEFELTHREGAAGLRVDLPGPGVRIPLCVGEDFGMQLPMEFELGKRHALRIHLSHREGSGTLRVTLDGEIKHEWAGLLTEIKANTEIEPGKVALDCKEDASYTFHAVRLRTSSKGATIDQRLVPSQSLPQFVRVAPLTGVLPESAHKSGEPRWQVFRREADYVNNVAWSSDGKSIAASDRSGNIRIHDAETFELQSILSGHRGSLTESGLAWQCQGSKLVSTSSGEAILWDTRDRSSVRLYRGQPNGAIWSFDGTQFVTGGHHGDGAVRLWSADGELIWTSNCEFVQSLAWSRDGTTIFISRGGDLRAINAVDGRWTPLVGPTFSGNLATSAQHDVLAIGRGNQVSDDYVEFWDYVKKEQVGTIKTGEKLLWPNALAFSPDGNHLAFGAQSAWTSVYEWRSGKAIRRDHSWLISPVHSVSWNATGNQVAYSAGTPRFFILSLNKDVATKRVGAESFGDSIHPGVSLAPDQRRYVRRFKEGLSIHKGDGSPPILVERCHPWGYGWSPDGKSIVCWDHGNEGLIIDADTGKVMTRLPDISGEMYRTAWSADGELLAGVGHKTPLIHVWNRDGSVKQKLDTGKEIAHALAISPDKKWLAAAFLDETGSGRIWSLETGAAVAEFNRDQKPLHFHHLYWLSDTDLAATSSLDSKEIRIWTLKDGQIESSRAVPGSYLVRRNAQNTNPWLVKHDGHSRQLTSLDESTTLKLQHMTGDLHYFQLNVPDNGQEISLLGSDEIIRTWDSKTGELLRLLVLLPNDQAITFDPTGKVLSQTLDADKELVYGVEQPNGALQLHTPAEFRDLIQ